MLQQRITLLSPLGILLASNMMTMVIGFGINIPSRMDGIRYSSLEVLNFRRRDMVMPLHESVQIERMDDNSNHPSSSSTVTASKWNPLTPTQIKFLRKETQKRQARKELCRFYLPDEETSSGHYFSSTTVQSILNQLKDSELVEVRGFARDEESTKHVFDISERLLWELNQHRNVERVLTQGHTMVVYATNPNLPQSIQLRTSYVPNAWEKRPKAPRDHRGQIIKE
jgi:RNA-binding protein YhbY